MNPIRRALLFLFIVLGLENVAVAAPRETRRALEIFFIDVQGGAATLIVTPERESILIDSGWPGLEDRDPKRIVHALKDLAGCDQLDHLITTHWHTDHYGGVAGLDRLVRIGQFWDRGLPEDPGAKGDFPDGPSAGDPLGKAYRKAERWQAEESESRRRPALQGNEGAGAGLRRRGRRPRPGQPLSERGSRSRPANPVCETHRWICQSIPLITPAAWRFCSRSAGSSSSTPATSPGMSRRSSCARST